MVDEASLTGESDPVKKGPQDEPWVRSGTQVGGWGVGCRGLVMLKASRQGGVCARLRCTHPVTLAMDAATL